MKLYIKISNGDPVEHPILKENMETAYPNVDLNNLPEGWAEFERVSALAPGPYQRVEWSYGWDNGIVKDIWTIVDMTADEKFQKISLVKSNYKADGGDKNWIFDEERCCHIPPEPMPNDGKLYTWDLHLERWSLINIEVVDHGLSPYPTDGKVYIWSDSRDAWVPKLE